MIDSFSRDFGLIDESEKKIQGVGQLNKTEISAGSCQNDESLSEKVQVIETQRPISIS